MSYLRIFENTPLKFVRLEDYTLKMQSEKTRFAKDYIYQSKLYMPFVLEYDQTDNLFFQYRTDYTPIIKLVDSLGTETTISSTLVGENIYQAIVDISALSGYYFITILGYEQSKPIVNIRSECFKIVANSELMLFESFGSDALNDPFVWTTLKSTIRLKAETKKRLSDTEISTFIDTDGNYTTTYALPKNARVLQVQLVPEYILNYLDIAFKHDDIYINKLQYTVEAGWEFESFNNMMYAPKITIIQKNYYNFVSDETLEGVNPVFPNSLFLINDTDSMLINATDSMTINN